MSSPPCPPHLQKSTSWGRAALKFSRKINSISPVWGLSKLPSNGMTASVPGWSSGSCWGRLDLVSTLKPGQGRGCPCPSWVLSRAPLVALLWPSSSLWGEESAMPREEPVRLYRDNIPYTCDSEGLCLDGHQLAPSSCKLLPWACSPQGRLCH